MFKRIRQMAPATYSGYFMMTSAETLECKSRAISVTYLIFGGYLINILWKLLNIRNKYSLLDFYFRKCAETGLL